MKTDSLRIRYDKGSDVLYVMTPRYGPAYGEEDGPGLVWRYLNTDNTLVGLTVMDYGAYWRPRMRELAKVMADHFHVAATTARRTLEQADS
jgi:hypothetical protein